MPSIPPEVVLTSLQPVLLLGPVSALREYRRWLQPPQRLLPQPVDQPLAPACRRPRGFPPPCTFRPLCQAQMHPPERRRASELSDDRLGVFSPDSAAGLPAISWKCYLLQHLCRRPAIFAGMSRHLVVPGALRRSVGRSRFATAPRPLSRGGCAVEFPRMPNRPQQHSTPRLPLLCSPGVELASATPRANCGQYHFETRRKIAVEL
ncbi:hypothetical protein GGX14DRAFT_478980 [Mycena pura]|uniref:Uncharacterized protein n=1 Tax=Mycena pura TaxID=153505 RepID=A0AAD6URU8_9AGAR|nr:hypothetical protein GGX14DRAFT_478980 [Mycena pura]